MRNLSLDSVVDSHMPKMFAALALVLVLALLAPAFLHVPAASACSCMAPPTESNGMRAMFEDDGYDGDWVMITGQAKAREASPVPYSSTTEFTVDRVYRGSTPERLLLLDASDGASCGMTVDTVGREFVVARLAEDDVYEPTFCGSFGITPALQAELDAASDGTAPLATDSDTSDDMPFLPIAFALGAAAIIIAAFVVVVRRNRPPQP